MPTFRALAAVRTATTVTALAAVILAGALTVFHAEATLLNEVKKLTGAGADGFFGGSVAISGVSGVVGQHGNDAAYVVRRDEGGVGNWGEVKKLTASDGRADDSFGASVAINGGTVVVGNWDVGTNSGTGAAYVFERDEGGPENWGEVQKLTASDAEVSDIFGGSVALSGDTAVVGAVGEDAGGDFAGAVYVFERNQGGPNNWGEVTKLIASDAQAGDHFGVNVAVSGDTAVVGAHYEDAGGANAGAAYVFERDQGGPNNWGEVKKLTASDAQTQEYFGISVGLSGDTAIVGAYRDGGPGVSLGAAYLFERNQGGPGNWGEVKKLTASDPQISDIFGTSVAIDGDNAIVGAMGVDAGSLNAGAAYVFERDWGGSEKWGEVAMLTASDAQAADFFGVRVAVSGDTSIVGAHSEDAGGSRAGAAYVFESGSVPTPTFGPSPTPTLTPTPTPNDSDGDGLADAFEASFGPGAPGTQIQVDNPETGNTAAATGFAAAGSTITSGSLTVTFPPGTTIDTGVDSKILIKFVPGALPQVGISGANLAGQTKTVEMPLGSGSAVCVDDRAVAKIGDGGLGPCPAPPDDPNVCPLGRIELAVPTAFSPPVSVSVPTKTQSPECTPTTYTVTRTSATRIKIEGLVHTTAGIVSPGVGGVAELPEVAGAPLETSGSSGTNAGLLAGVLTAIAAGTVTLGGAAWYARRRLHSPTAP